MVPALGASRLLQAVHQAFDLLTGRTRRHQDGIAGLNDVEVADGDEAVRAVLDHDIAVRRNPFLRPGRWPHRSPCRSGRHQEADRGDVGLLQHGGLVHGVRWRRRAGLPGMPDKGVRCRARARPGGPAGAMSGAKRPSPTMEADAFTRNMPLFARTRPGRHGPRPLQGRFSAIGPRRGCLPRTGACPAVCHRIRSQGGPARCRR